MQLGWVYIWTSIQLLQKINCWQCMVNSRMCMGSRFGNYQLLWFCYKKTNKQQCIHMHRRAVDIWKTEKSLTCFEDVWRNGAFVVLYLRWDNWCCTYSIRYHSRPLSTRTWSHNPYLFTIFLHYFEIVDEGWNMNK